MDIHIHTKESSYCARVDARDVVHLYKEKGYQGLIITDHYNREFFDHFPNETWKEKVDHYLEGYARRKRKERKSEWIFFSVLSSDLSSILTIF